MDIKTRASIVRRLCHEAKQTARSRRRLDAGMRSARATDDALDGVSERYQQPYRQRGLERLPSDDAAGPRIDARIARGRRGRAVRGMRLTWRTDVASPARPTWSRRDHVGATPRPTRATRTRIMARVPHDAPPRQSVIHHGLTADEIVAREPRLRSAARRRRRIERRFAGTAH